MFCCMAASPAWEHPPTGSSSIFCVSKTASWPNIGTSFRTKPPRKARKAVCRCSVQASRLEKIRRLERDVDIDLTNAAGNPAVVLLGNKDFPSEKLLAFELGERWQAASDLSIDLATFYNRYRDLACLEFGTPFFLHETFESDSSDSLSHLAGFATSTVGALAEAVLILFLGLFLAADPQLYTRGIARLVTAVWRGRTLEILNDLGSAFFGRDSRRRGPGPRTGLTPPPGVNELSELSAPALTLVTVIGSCGEPWALAISYWGGELERVVCLCVQEASAVKQVVFTRKRWG
jgi:hypothetical protein